MSSNTNGRGLTTLDSAGADGASGAPVAIQIPVHRGSISDMAAAGDRLMVVNHGGDSVSIIDTDRWRVAGTIADLAEPFAVASASADRVYVSTATPSYDAIQAIDPATNTVVASYPVALSVSDLVASADGTRVYIARNGARDADVAVLNTATGAVEVIDIAVAPGTTTECIRISPHGSRVYVGTNGPTGGHLVVIDTGRRANKSPRVIRTIDVDSTVRDIALSPGGDLVYIAGCGTDFGAVIDVVDTRRNKITGTRKIAEATGLLTRLTISGDGDRAYLVSDDSVTVVCAHTQDVIDSVNIPARPSCVAESSDGRYLYIADYSGTVTVAPVTTGSQRRFPQAALESKRSVDLFVPDLLQYDAVLV